MSPMLKNGGRLPAGIENLQRQYTEGGELYFHFPHYAGNTSLGPRTPASAIRDGDFKLVKVYAENGEPDKVYLFNLADNVTDSNGKRYGKLTTDDTENTEKKELSQELSSGAMSLVD